MTLLKPAGTGLILALFIYTSVAQSLNGFSVASVDVETIVLPWSVSKDEAADDPSDYAMASLEVLLEDFVWGREVQQDQIGRIEQYGYDLSGIKELRNNHHDDPYFFDRYYHPEAQYLTGYHLGRSGMPIIHVDQQGNLMTIDISCMTEKARMYYTIDGQIPDEKSQLYDGPLTLPITAEVRVKSIRPDLEHSVVCLINGGEIRQLPSNEGLDEDKIMGVFTIPDSEETVVKYKTQKAGTVAVSIIDAHRQVHEMESIHVDEAHFGHIRMNTSRIPEGPYLVKFKFESGRITYRQVTR